MLCQNPIFLQIHFTFHSINLNPGNFLQLLNHTDAAARRYCQQPDGDCGGCGGCAGGGLLERSQEQERAILAESWHDIYQVSLYEVAINIKGGLSGL